MSKNTTRACARKQKDAAAATTDDFIAARRRALNDPFGPQRLTRDTPMPVLPTPAVAEPKPYFPTDYKERKGIPICTGVLDYFPLALVEVAKVSFAGNEQHNPGEELHWARGKSMNQLDTAIRHVMERGGGGFTGRDTDGAYHLAKAIWRLMAQLQLDLEAERGLPPSRASR